ncbi:hypothetical protein Gotri_001271 [Gossypium trilobum]|uniref:F-box domain-containing protein n=1 Tax=Gossypium trilobum TaxID=34281 RepID=A0A7J9FE96_9ROSI|nr:hypothetical protein [Gossypium trilobum]
MAKQAKNEGVLDRISTLPDHMLCHMLSFLPIKDAVRTSVLSPRWRYLFTFMSTLDLYDYRQFRGFTRRDFNDFKNFVDRLLLFPKQQVRLECFRVTENASDGDCPRLYGWICAVLSRGIKELVVSYGKNLRLPTLLFTCQSLVTLELDIPGDMKIPPDVSLPNLKSLNLSNFLFSDGLIFKLVSSCHVLEELYMEFVKLGRNITEVNIHSLSLKRMTLEFVLVNRDKDYKMVINTPNLEYFKFYDMLADGYRVSSMTSLEHANIRVHQCPEYAIYDVNRERAATNLLQAICNVKCLYLLITHAETLIPMGPEPVFAFHKLVQLKFVNETEAWVGTWILEFLHCVPNLEILHLALDAASEGIKPLAENVPSCVSFHLTEIRVSRFVGDEPMFQMISFFLKHATVLETLIIAMKYLTEKEELSITKRLLELPRNSRSCQVITE